MNDVAASTLVRVRSRRASARHWLVQTSPQRSEKETVGREGRRRRANTQITSV